jgi:hypothetical protein
MREFKSEFNPNHWTVVGFYPYTSLVNVTIMTQQHNYKNEDHDFLEFIGNHFKDKAIGLGCNWDNKVVVQIVYTQKTISNHSEKAFLYIGRKDGIWSLGLGVVHDAWIGHNIKYFPLEKQTNQ